MRRDLVGLAVATGLLLGAGSVGAQEKVDVRVVKYAGLADAVLKNRDKVVLVDFWHTT